MQSTIKLALNHGVAFGILAVAGAPLAHAADAAPPAGENGVSEIIVTAQKTSQVASKVPQALSVFTGDMLKEKGVVNVANLSNITPGLEIGSASHGVSISVRGVTTTDVTSKGEQNIVFSVDGVPIGRPQLMGLAFFDLDRVEVLRGPQGTLYGKSSTGGAINVITAKPQHEFAASASAELGNYNTRRFDAMVNVPVSDDFALRAAFTSNAREGFIKPVLGNFVGGTQQANLGAENNWLGRVTGKYDFAPGGSLVVTGTFGHIGGADGSGTVIYNRVTKASGDDRFKVYYNPFAGSQGPSDNFFNINAELNFDLGPVHVTYDGGHQWWHGEDNNDPGVNGANDAGAYSYTLYSSHLTSDSHEVRLSNADPKSRVEWVLGANYFHEYNDERDLNYQTANVASCLASPSSSYLNAGVATNCSTPNPQIVGASVHTAKGVFGQASLHVNDKLKVTLGGRYSDDSVSRNATLAAGGTADGSPLWLTTNGAALCGPPNACGTATQVTPNVASNSTSAFTWRVGMDYQITPRAMVYASVSTGYKGGGFNDIDPAASTRQPGSYGAEHVTAYEVGFKGRITPELSYNTSAYYYDYSKYQLTGATFLANTPYGVAGVVIYTSLAPATMYGWENELTWKPTPDDTFNAALTLEKAFFNNGPNAARVGFLYSNQVYWGGKTLDRVPGVAGNLAYEHRFLLESGAAVRLGFNSKLSNGYWLSDLAGTGNPFSGVYATGSEPKQYRQKGYTRTDINLSYTSADSRFTLAAYVRNVENKVQLQNAPSTAQPGWGSDGQWVRVNLPRTFGARATVKF